MSPRSCAHDTRCPARPWRVSPFQVHEDGRRAGAREASEKIEVRRFLERALDAIGHLIERVVERGARPGGLHDHRPERECRIFVAAEIAIGHRAGGDGDDHAIHHERAVLERPFGKIELHHGAAARRRVFWPGCSAWTPAVTTMSPVSRPLGDGNRRWIVAQHVDVAQRNGEARRIDHPHRGPPIAFGERGCGNFDGRRRIELHAPDDGCAEPHGRRRIGQSDLDLECPGDGVGLRRDFANAPNRGYGRIVGEAHVYQRIARRRSQHLARHIEHRIAPALRRHADNQLAGLTTSPGSAAVAITTPPASAFNSVSPT